MKHIAPVLVASVFLSSTAFAQMMEVDTDEDGMASYEELTAVYTDVTEEQFTAMDTNADGSLDEDEMTVAMDAGTLAKPE